MKVLVVGATGLIGRHAVLSLLTRGHTVRALARTPPPPGLLPPSVEFAQGDLLTSDLAPALDGTDALVHAAGTDYRVLPRGSAHEFFHRINVVATARLFRAAVAAGVKRAVLVTSFYPAVRPELVSHPYIRSRVDSEEESLHIAGDRLSIIQPPFVIGPSPGRPSLPETLARWVRSRAPLLSPPGGSNFISAHSTGESIAAALEHGRPGARYLIGDENLPWSTLLTRFARAAGRQTIVRTAPQFALTTAAALLKLYAHLRRRDPGVDPIQWSAVWGSNFFYDSTPARTELRYPTANLDQAIAAVLSSQSSTFS